jgi:hypothetical protein
VFQHFGNFQDNRVQYLLTVQKHGALNSAGTYVHTVIPSKIRVGLEMCLTQLLARLAVARQIPGLNLGPKNPSLSNSNENKKVGPVN